MLLGTSVRTRSSSPKNDTQIRRDPPWRRRLIRVNGSRRCCGVVSQFKKYVVDVRHDIRVPENHSYIPPVFPFRREEETGFVSRALPSVTGPRIDGQTFSTVRENAPHEL